MGLQSNIIANGYTGQVARLSNGWLVYIYYVSSNNYQLKVSKNDGATWSDLCILDAGYSLDYVVSVAGLVSNGNNLLVAGSYSATNDNQDRTFSCYFDATTVTSTTNLYNSNSIGVYKPYINLRAVKLLYGTYHYLQRYLTSSSNTLSYTHAVSTTNSASTSTGVVYVSGTQNTPAVATDSDVHGLASGESWILYSTSNTLNIRRRLSTGAYQTAQLIATLTTGYYIRRIRAVEHNGLVYVFFSYLSADNANVGLGYVTTSDGITFSTVKNLLSNPFATTSTQHLDFDVIVDGNNIGFLLAIPNGANRTLYTGKFRSNSLTIKSTGLTVPNKTFYAYSIRNVAISNRLLYFTVDFDSTNLVKFRLDVDGIRQLVSGTWTNLEQANRYNGSTWQEQNGKRMNSSAWNDIT